MSQKWLRLTWYVEDYLNLIYRYYAEHGIAYICTYYHLDLTNSICDKDQLDGASYETIGDLSGLLWEKIIMLPIYNTERVNIPFTADEKGFGKFEQRTSLNFPSTYGITPTSTDFVIFDELIVNKDSEARNVPVFRVVNKERSINSFFDFWRVNLEVTFYTKENIETQVRETFIFSDYEKDIYPISVGEDMVKMMDKNSNLQLGNAYKQNIGLYFGV